ncbi:ribosomal RNA-processing protein 8 [Carcharodon carcharias]|uniref:ribosomal RNA-processing protein 8 n=1 Tax=Carcharodon carcharias TaxID=13397 RepID=UPI001B7EAFB3|nr:ribosomal RNA-processing protein 8 [Carcharodon carcharias]
MFAEEDWNDDLEARALNKTLFHKVEASHCIAELNVQAPGGKKKQRLLNTLRTLSAAGAPDQDPGGTHFDPECGTAKKSKRKRNRGKKERVGTSPSEQDVGKGSGARLKSPPAQIAAGKENQSRVAGAKENGHLEAGNRELGEGTSAPCLKLLRSNSGQGTLTRKQWRNRMKNKHRSKNKFRPRETSLAESGGQMENIEHDRTLIKSRPEQGEEKSVTDAHEPKIKRRKGRGEEWNKPAERTDCHSSNENMTNYEKRARDQTQKGETISNCKRTRRKGTPEKILMQERKDCIPGQPGSLARVLPTVEVNGTESHHSSPSTDRSAALRTKMEERLKSAHFRYINEQLYTSSSAEAMKFFTEDKNAFEIYHQGFTAQIERWPENPVNRIIQYIRNRPSSAVVADFGCGDCKIARSVNNKVYSFDLVALNEYVTVCDMASVPLTAESVDIVVFCLALMGTNLLDFLAEATRVLRRRGILKIAEVASRFEDVQSFINVVGSLGFKMISKDTENSYFYLFEFRKNRPPREKDKLPQLQLKPCLYKKR